MEKNLKGIIDSIIRKLRISKDCNSKDDNSIDDYIDGAELNKTDIDEPYEGDQSKCKIIL